jgi:hypothetical protein
MIHLYTPDRNLKLIRRVAAALKQGGLMVIMDQIAGKGRGSAARAIARLQGLQLFNSVMGQTYPAREIVDWLKEAGFLRIQTHQLRNAPSSGLVVGMKAS